MENEFKINKIAFLPLFLALVSPLLQSCSKEEFIESPASLDGILDFKIGKETGLLSGIEIHTSETQSWIEDFNNDGFEDEIMYDAENDFLTFDFFNDDFIEATYDEQINDIEYLQPWAMLYMHSETLGVPNPDTGQDVALVEYYPGISNVIAGHVKLLDPVRNLEPGAEITFDKEDINLDGDPDIITVRNTSDADGSESYSVHLDCGNGVWHEYIDTDGDLIIDKGFDFSEIGSHMEA